MAAPDARDPSVPALLTPQSSRALARGFWRGPGAGRAWWLTFLLLASLLANIAVQYAINVWNGAFFDALERRASGNLTQFVLIIAGLAVLSVSLGVAQMLCKMRLQIEWRQWMSRALMRRWLHERRFYRLGVSAPGVDAPEFRIAEDARVATEVIVDFAHGFISAMVTGLVFIGVLWRSGGRQTFWGVEVPGFMVWAALIYAGTMTLSMWLAGHPLIAKMRTRNASEASLRFNMGRVRENAESIALLGGGRGEETFLDRTLVRVITAWRSVMWQQARLTVLTSANWVGSPIVPLLLMAPKYLAGSMTLGALIQTATAFGQVQGSLTWFVDNYPRIADWLASVGRVRALSDAMQDLDNGEFEGPGITGGSSPDESLHLVGVAIAQRDGAIMVDEAEASFAPGERVLLSGASGIGKSTLIRAIAGLWRWGRGRVLVPGGSSMAFLPQRPYMPLGTFRDIVCYPSPGGTHDDATLQAVMERCELGLFVPRLDEVERWDKVLSGGEQQKVAFARVLLGRPGIVFMDEATSALDTASQDRLMRMFAEELPEAILISVGHRPELADYHTRRIALVRTRRGVRMQIESDLPAA